MTNMDPILAIETSVAQASIALWRDGSVVFEEEFTTDRNHNSMIFEPVSRALEMLEGAGLGHLLVGTGPGSYSGTRVGIATAQGLAIANHCPAVGLGSLAATPEARSQTPALAVGDARRGLYYISRISPTGEAMAAELMEMSAFEKRLQDADDACLFSMDNSTSWPLESATRQRITQSRPEARWLIELWLQLPENRQKELSLQPLSPVYLRPPFTSKAKGGHPLLRS